MNNFIDRIAINRVRSLARQFLVVMITGPRQVGKTTLLKYLTANDDNVNYVSLDNLKARELAINDPELFLDTYKAPLIIDEFQYAPNLLSYIKIIIDNKKFDSVMGKTERGTAMYYLTGSQSFLSMKDVTESLAGRVGIMEMYGLSTREICGVSGVSISMDIDDIRKRDVSKINSVDGIFDVIFRGSYPELYIRNDIKLEDFYDGYVKTYIERDIRDLIKVSDELAFMKFMTSVAARTGQELNLTEIANDVGMSVSTVSSWLSILCNTGLVILIQPYLSNVIKRVVKSPKIYFMDTGLACYLVGYTDAVTLEKSAYNGAIFETYVVSEMVKSLVNSGVDFKRCLYYYRDNNKREIDLIFDYNNKLYPIEIKKSKNPGRSAIKHFEVIKDFNKDIGNGLILCMIDEVMPLDRNNYMVPIWYI